MTKTDWSPLSEWVEKLDDVTQEGSNYRAACPKHGGHGFLFREDRSTNRVFFDCKAGCEYGEVVGELRKLGLRLWGDNLEFPYYDANGNLVFIKVTYRRKSDGQKGRFYKCPGSNGVPSNHNSEKKGTRGADGKCKRCGIGKAEGFFYRLPELLAGIQAGAEVWLCEGEKDAEAVLENKGARNIVVTSTMNGIDDWNAEYRDVLAQAASVVIVADNDTQLGTGKNPGYRGAWDRYVSLSDFNVRVVRAAEGKDAFDHFGNGHEIDDFVEVSPDELAKYANPESPSGSLGEIVEFDYTQSAYAERFVALYGDRFRYVPGPRDDGCWLYYDDGHWCVDRHDSALYFAYKLCRQVLKETPKLQSDGKKLNPDWSTAKERCGAGNIGAIVRIARLIRPIETSWSKFDRDPFLLNTPSGTRDLRTGAVRSHSPADMITKMTPYDLQDSGPVFDEYFAQVQPDPHWREQILRSLGYALSGRYGQYLFVHSGSGGNGKTTLLELAERALGPDYAVEASWKILTAASEDAHETILAELESKRLAYVQLGNRALSPEQLRTIVAEPNLKARRMRQDSRTIRATHTLHVAQNDPPVMKKLDASVRRRIVHIAWNVVIPADERDDDLSLRLEPGYLLKLMIEAYQRFNRDELDLSATTDYFRNNALFAFLEDTFVSDPDGFVTTDEALVLYNGWAERNPGVRGKVSDTALGIAMTDFGFGKGVKNVKREGKRTTVRGRTGYRMRVTETGTEE